MGREMADAQLDARVLVVAPDHDVDAPDDLDGLPRVREATGLADELGVEVVAKRGTMAVEYLRELGPTVDCVVCLGGCADWIDELTGAAPSIPLVVYADRTPSAPVDGIVARDGGTSALATRVHDQIRRSRERDRLDEANAKLNALNRYTREMTACETVEAVTDEVVAAVTEALGYGHCVLGLREGDELIPYGNTFQRERSIELGSNEGVAGRTFRSGETYIVDDYRSYPDRRRMDRAVLSVVSVPVGDHGVLQVTADQVAAFDERDAEFLEIVGSHAKEALSRIRRETDLRVERDRLHAFFEGLPAPTVYVEADVAGDVVLRDANAAYEAAFPGCQVGADVTEAFPTATERRLFGEAIRADECVTESIRRDTASTDDCSLTVTLVPVRTVGLEAAGFGVYVADVTLP